MQDFGNCVNWCWHDLTDLVGEVQCVSLPRPFSKSLPDTASQCQLKAIKVMDDNSEYKKQHSASREENQETQKWCIYNLQFS